jgi:hypothetical protein
MLTEARGMSADDGSTKRRDHSLTSLVDAIEATASGGGEPLQIAIATLVDALPCHPSNALVAGLRSLAILQESRAFDELVALAEQLVRLGHDHPEIRRRYAQALVDTGRPVGALALLEPIARSATGEVPQEEHAVALGVTGRAYKQLYIESRRQGGSPASQTHLRQALAAYTAGGSKGSIKDRRWCRINIVALLMRGARDRTIPSGEAEARQLAECLVAELIRGRPLDDLTQWDAVTLAEACVALGDMASAAHWYGRFVEDPRVTAFQLASAIRQLDEVWGITVASPEGGALLAALKTKLLGLSSGTIALSEGDRAYLRGVDATGAEFEAVLGKEGPMHVRWLKAGIEAASAVGRIRDRTTGTTYGTGFLVRGGDLRSDLGDEPVVLTNNHVVSGRSSAALGPEEAEIVFDETEARAPSMFGSVIFEAPADGLDTTVLKLDRIDQRTPLLPLAPLDYLADDFDRLPAARRRAIVIGHADGRELAVSLTDTEIVDLGYRDTERQGGLFVHYRTPTAPGSSGSPVFAPERWQVAALHHAGPSHARGIRRLSGKPGHHRANEGIAIASIARAMAKVSRPVALAAPAVQVRSPAEVARIAAIQKPLPTSPRRALPPIKSAEQLEETLKRLDIPEKDLRPLLTLDREGSQAFAPEVVAKGAYEIIHGLEHARRPDGTMAESALALVESLNAIARWRRQRAYAAKVASGWTGLRFVAQGDSWFQYPFLVEDIIDHLFEEHAILDLSGAGRTLHDLGLDDDLLHAVKSEVPNGVLLSGGGNDILGEQAIRLYLKNFAPDRTVADYAEPTLAAHLDLIVAQYERIVGQLQAISPSLRIFCHGYDWAIPNAQKGDWLAKPMVAKGIVEPELQRGLVRLLIDRFNEAMRGLERRYPGRLLVVDCRGAVGAECWYDELHPTDDGFADVAQRFRERITKAFDLVTR